MATLQLLAVLSGGGIYIAALWLYSEPPRWRQYILCVGFCLLLLSLTMFGFVYGYCWSQTELLQSSVFTCTFLDAITFQKLGRMKLLVVAFGAIAFFVGGVLAVGHGVLGKMRTAFGGKHVR